MLFFCLFQCFAEKEYQTESKRNETFGGVIFGKNVIQRTWSASQEAPEDPTRVPGTPPRAGHAPHHRGPLEHPPTYLFLLYIPTYPETFEEHHENLIPPPQPSVSARSHLGVIAGALPEGGSTMEGVYIISKASPMSYE